MLTGAQIRAARGLLGWSQKELSKKAELGFATVQRAEREAASIKGMVDTAVKIQTALKHAGIEFIDADEEKGPGVRLTRPIPES